MNLAALAHHLNAQLQGDPALAVDSVATLQNAQPGQLSFLANSRYRRYLSDTRATAVILAPEDATLCPVAMLIVSQPYLAYAKAAALLNPPLTYSPGIAPNATIDPSAVVDVSASIAAGAVIEAGARIAARVRVGPNCVIAMDVHIGEDTVLVANISLGAQTRIGQRCLIHPGVVIGSDGFGLAQENGRWIKVPQLGAVRIGDDVEIGANTTIDRGALENTVIEDGVKLDNQIQIAHNVRIGAHTAIAGCTGIAGSTQIGKRCTIGGGVGIAGHLRIGDDVHLTGMTFVTKSIEQAGLYSSGIPADTNAHWQRNVVRFRQLDRLARRIKALEEASRFESSDNDDALNV